MKTETIHNNEMTPQPCGTFADKNTHNLTSVVPTSTIVAAHDHKEINRKPQILQSHTQAMDVLLSANTVLPTGNKQSTGSLKRAALLEIAHSMGRAGSIAIAILFLVSMSFAQQQSPSAADIGDPFATSEAGYGTSNVDNIGEEDLSSRSERTQGLGVPPPKAEELSNSDVPKNEGSERSLAENFSAGKIGNNDVGVIPDAGVSCPSGSERITIYMDDEDHKNNDSISGWTGAITQPGGNNTQFVFCRADGQKFKRTAGNYAVLKLAAECPPGSISFERDFDNECKNNQNRHTGDISPNKQTSDRCIWNDSYTFLKFCFFPRTATSYGWIEQLPDLGIRYGVFAASNFPGGLATGIFHTDDEDDTRIIGDTYDQSYYKLGTAASAIISGTDNTDIRVVKVR